MRVVPEKRHARADQRAADHREFARARHVADQQVVGEHHVARDIGHDAVHQRHRDGAADRQAVEAVGEVDRVAEADDPEKHQDEEREQPKTPANCHTGYFTNGTHSSRIFCALNGCHRSTARRPA
jgi:hypothetical protein